MSDIVQRLREPAECPCGRVYHDDLSAEAADEIELLIGAIETLSADRDQMADEIERLEADCYRLNAYVGVYRNFLGWTPALKGDVGR